MTQVSVDTAVTPGDVQAALQFTKKRALRHKDPLDGIAASVFSVMLVAGRAMTDTGVPLSSVDSMLEQFKMQVLLKLAEGGAQ